MWWALRVYVQVAVMVVVICAAAAWLPDYLTRVQTMGDYDDMKGLKDYSAFWIEPPPYQVGRIAAFKFGDMPDQVALGRIVALPGDTVEYKDGKLLVHGSLVEGLDQRTLPTPPSPDIGPLVVPEGHLFVLSDRHGYDSTVRGLIPPDALIGKIKL